MATQDQKRIIALQKQVKIARDAMSNLTYYPLVVRALDQMEELDCSAPLQGLVGHGANVRR